MRRPQGYATTTIDGVIVQERDTFTCRHCNGVVEVEPGTVDTLSCLRCDGHICNPCAATLVRTMKCVPFEQKLEALENRDRIVRTMRS